MMAVFYPSECVDIVLPEMVIFVEFGSTMLQQMLVES